MSLVFQASRIPFTGFGNSRFPCEFFGRTHRPSSIGIQISLKTAAPPVADAVVLSVLSGTPGPCLQGLAGLTAPVGVALLLVVFLGGADPASPPYRTQRVVFAWLVDVPVADPIRGQSSTDLSDRRSFVARYRPRGPCVYPAVPAARTCRWPARWLVTLSLRFAAMCDAAA